MNCSNCQFPADLETPEGKLYCIPCFKHVPGTATLLPTNPEFITSSKFYRVPRLVTKDNSVAIGLLKALSRIAG